MPAPSGRLKRIRDRSRFSSSSCPFGFCPWKSTPTGGSSTRVFDDDVDTMDARPLQRLLQGWPMLACPCASWRGDARWRLEAASGEGSLGQNLGLWISRQVEVHLPAHDQPPMALRHCARIMMLVSLHPDTAGIR